LWQGQRLTDAFALRLTPAHRAQTVSTTRINLLALQLLHLLPSPLDHRQKPLRDKSAIWRSRACSASGLLYPRQAALTGG